jgi:hypothetical protein
MYTRLKKGEKNMLVTKNTQKTVTIEMQPGERFDLNNEGYSINSMTLRWNDNGNLKAELESAIHDIKQYKDTDVEYMLYIEAQDRKEEIIRKMFETLPAYRVKRVWTGFNY